MIIEPTNPPTETPEPSRSSNENPEVSTQTEAPKPHESPKGAPQFGVPISSGNPKIHKSHNRRPFIIALILVLVVGAGLYYWFNVRKEPAKSSSTQQSQTNQSESTDTTVVDKIFYLKRTGSEKGYTLYSNTTDGKNETEIDKYSEATITGALDQNETEILFTVGTDVYYMNKSSADKPIKVTTFTAGQDITAGKIVPPDSKTIILSVTSDGTSKSSMSTLMQVDINGKNKKVIYEGDSRALIVTSWDLKNDRVFVKDNCWQCDGSTDINKSYAIKISDGTKTTSTPYSDLMDNQVSKVVTASSGEKNYYFVATTDQTTKISPALGPEYYVGAPYSLSIDGKTTLGAYGEKKLNSDGIPVEHSYDIYIDNSDKFYASFDENLYNTDDKTAIIIATTSDKKPISKIEYASNVDGVLKVSDSIRYLSFADKKETSITQSDPYLVVVGVSTKTQ